MHQAAAFSQGACIIVKARSRSKSAACLGPGWREKEKRVGAGVAGLHSTRQPLPRTLALRCLSQRRQPSFAVHLVKMLN